MPTEQHANLVQLGAKWLRRNGFGVVATELTAHGCREQADVIGFRSSCSALIEVKVSRGDFLADAKKTERVSGIGLGVYRFYLCPVGLIEINDIPNRWGLLYEVKGRVVEILRPRGNIWPSYRDDIYIDGWTEFQHQPNLRAERNVLYSIARRLSA